jgi:hypothetical protein
MREKSRYFAASQFAWMPPAMKMDELPDIFDVGFFSSQTHVPHPAQVSHCGKQITNGLCLVHPVLDFCGIYRF